MNDRSSRFLMSRLSRCSLKVSPCTVLSVLQCYAMRPQPEAGNVGDSTAEKYGKTAKEAVNFVTRGAAYLANAAKRTVVGDGLANETQNPAGEVTATRCVGRCCGRSDSFCRCCIRILRLFRPAWQGLPHGAVRCSLRVVSDQHLSANTAVTRTAGGAGRRAVESALPTDTCQLCRSAVMVRLHG